MAIVPNFSNLGNELTQTVDNLKSGFLNQLNSRQNSSISGLASPLPWQTSQSVFFPYVVIKPDRWDQLFPYRLVVIDALKGNQIVNGTPQSVLKVKKDAGRTTLEFVPLGSQWIFQLPITPQQLSITDQYAIQTTATLRGILEEHSGLKFKNIVAAGTMGVWPFRESVTSPPGSPGLVQSLFGGTIEAAGSLLGQVARVINTATSNHPAAKPNTVRPEASTAGPTSTGYYHAMALQQFFEQYAEAKKDPANAGWRLVFDIPKQNQSFVVTPMQFQWQQSEAKPMQINYTMQLKAWRRIDLQLKASPNVPSIQPISPGILQRILNTVTAARSATSAAVNLIGAVRSDVTAPLEVLRQTSLFVKDLAGAIVSAADLPFQLQSDYKSAIGDFLKNVSPNGLSSAIASNPRVASSFKSLKSSYASKEGLSIDAVSSGQLGAKAAQNQSIDPSHNVFDKPEQNFDFLNQAPLSGLRLNVSQQNKIDQAIEDARNITVDDLRQFRSTIQTLAFQLANNFGAGDAFTAQVYNLPAPISRVTPMTVDDYEILKSLYDVMQSYDILTATTQVDDNNRQTNMEYVAGLADQAGIEFSVPVSKVLAPIPFGLTMEGIASRYLGDPQRWIEIATLNNLRDPYIDEDGFQYELLSNASGRQITIPSADNLYLGQKILLQSSTQIPSARSILDIDKLSDTSFLITLDGPPNLDNFLLVDGAYLQAYLPGTVNSQQKIFIPSDLPVPNDPNIVIPANASADPLSGMSKVDLLLTETGDLAVNNFGDFRYAYGITNIIQALKIKMGTVKGTVLLHPDFGFGIRPGTINADVDVQEIYNSINKLISEDPRFQGLSTLQINLNGPTLTISMAVQLAGQNGVFPITFELSA